MPVFKKSFQYGPHTLTLETGEMARQADAAVVASLGDTVVLCTAVAAKKAAPGRDFFPLTVNYQEKFYAAGRIPGGFFKREGRPTEKETLTSRLIDRPVRPLFPDGFYNEVQVVTTVISIDPEIDADIPAMVGASAALALSGVPFNGPIGAARVGYKDGQYLLNPTAKDIKTSALNLVVAGTKDGVMMVESEANCLTEEVMLGSVVFGHEQMQVAIKAINELVAECGKPRWDWKPNAATAELEAAVRAAAHGPLSEAYRITEKQARYTRVGEIKKAVIEQLTSGDAPAYTAEHVDDQLFRLESSIVRERILNGEPRIDGRDSVTVRPITIKVGVTPRTHGSALFTRGETQALVVTTLGTGRDSQIIDAPEGEHREPFMLHYNFPPFSVGETGMMSGPKRREIGHGNLARRGVAAVMPDMEKFPYVIRVVSEILESNGSSSMASVCGASLAMMDAGVPLKSPVAGVAMGLVLEGKRYKVLTDILGDEDHLGDMEGLFLYAILLGPVDHHFERRSLVSAKQAVTRTEDGVEDLGVQALVLLERLQRVVKTCVKLGARIPGDRDTHELDMCRLTIFLPALEEGVQRVAGVTAVPKNFDDFDLARGDVGRNRGRHSAIVPTLLPAGHPLSGCLCVGDGSRERSADQQRADDGRPHLPTGKHQRRPWI